MDDHAPGVSELLSFVSRYPVESMEIYAGSGPIGSIDLICGDDARLVGVPLGYLQVLEDRGLLPREIVSRLNQLRSTPRPAVSPL